MKNKFILFAAFLTAFPLINPPELHANTLIAPDDVHINYYGRFDMTDPQKPRCNWSGAIIEARFPGPLIGMRIQSNNGYFDIEIDGKPDTVIHTADNSAHDCIIATELSDELHTVRIILRHEDHWSTTVFHGLYLADDLELHEAPPQPQRKIEFIGDSYTAGYGIESSGRSCNQDQLRKYTNANKTYAMKVTEAFHAQAVILGWSGAGMVRNYGEGAKRSENPFPSYYNKTLGEADQLTWDFTRWIPDIVVVNLGTNDFSTTPHPDDSMYIGDYHAFLGKIHKNYPDASVICVSTGSGPFEDNVKRVVNEQQTTYNQPAVYFYTYPSSLELTGCDWHPSLDDNRKVADGLIKTITENIEWDTAIASTAPRQVSSYKKIPQCHFSVSCSRHSINIRYRDVQKKPMEFSLLNARGELLLRNRVDMDGFCRMNSRQLSPGLYFAGNNLLGWVKIVKR